jgi:hypothetical protein
MKDKDISSYLREAHETLTYQPSKPGVSVQTRSINTKVNERRRVKEYFANYETDNSHLCVLAICKLRIYNCVTIAKVKNPGALDPRVILHS